MERFTDRMRRERADAILEQTARIAAEHGWDALRVEDVARSTGVAKGTIYLDFPAKADLVQAALRKCAHDLLHLMTAQVDTKSMPGERLHEAIAFLARLPIDRPDLTALLRWSGGGGGGGVSKDLERYFERLVTDAQASDEFSNNIDPQLATQVILAAAAVPAVTKLARRSGSETVLHQ